MNLLSVPNKEYNMSTYSFEINIKFSNYNNNNSLSNADT